MRGMKCPECVDKPKRKVTHEVTLPVVPGAPSPRVVRACFLCASCYEMVEGVSIRRIGSDSNTDAFNVMRQATEGR